MDEIRQDLLSLNYSPSFQISGMQEADVNLSLPPATLSASISGSVTGGALPLADATVTVSYTHLDVYKRQLPRTWGQPCGTRLVRCRGAMTASPEAARCIPSPPGRVANTAGNSKALLGQSMSSREGKMEVASCSQ